jgi:peptidoglycan DL-endopeptidase RipA
MKPQFKSIAFGILAATAITTATPAMADLSQVKDAPYMGVCYEKIDAYGGLYLMRSVMVNNSGAPQYANAVTSGQNGATIAQDGHILAAGVWHWLQPLHLSIVNNDIYRYYRGGEKVLEMPAHGVPWYLNHCNVKYSTTSDRVNTALRFALAYLDAPYVGGGAGDFRFGVPGNGGWHQMSGQNSYLAPAGVSGFDCSGLVVAMYRRAGIEIPVHYSGGMKDTLPGVASWDLRPGDLIVKDGHVAIFAGDPAGDGVGMMIEAKPIGGQYGDGRVKGVHLRSARDYLAPGYQPINGYTLRRVPGAQ